jgi:serine/threonine protein kinase
MIDNLTLDSILMTQRDDGSVPRISNFSNARILDPNQKVQENYRTINMFVAPEIAKHQPYDFKVDCWSFGVILYFMLSTQFHITKYGEKDIKGLKRAIGEFQFNDEQLVKRQKP